MIPLQIWHLKRLCRKYGLDYQYIDDEISYAENKAFLEALVPKFDIDLAEWKGREEQFERETPEIERPAVPERLVGGVFECWLRYSRRHLWRLRRALTGFDEIELFYRRKNGRRVATGYLAVRGDGYRICGVLNYLAEKDIPYRTVINHFQPSFSVG